MKTSVIEVTDMLSVLTVDEVENRFGEVPGVGSATVNYAVGNATVRYDETLLDVADIKILVHQRGQQSAGESAAKDVSEDKPAHNLEQNPGVKPTPAPVSASPPEPAIPKATPAAPATAPKPPARAGDEQQSKEAPAAPHQHPAPKGA